MTDAATDERPGTLSRVRTWLAKTGYPLEMKTAAAFRAQRFSPEAGRYYVAEDGETLREIDVVATGWHASPGTNSPWLELVFVVECKASRAQPWVAFLGDQRFTHDEDIVRTMRVDVFGPPDMYGDVIPQVDIDMVRGLHKAPLLHSLDRYAYAVTETGDKPAHAYNAVRQVASAVDGYARDRVAETDRPVLRVTVPIVVTSAPLVTCYLDDDGSEVLDEVERVLLVTRPGPAASLAGVWIVRDTSLDRLAADARACADGLHLARSVQPAHGAGE